MENKEEQATDFYRKKNYAVALRLFLQLAATAPEREDWQIYIANCYDGLGQKEEAVSHYLKALKKNRKSDTAAANLAIIFYETQQYAEAGKYAGRALKINPQNASALTVKGNLLYRRKDGASALKYYLRALDASADYYTALINAITVYFEQHDYATAYYYARRAVDRYPDSAEAKNLLADICLENGRPDEAIVLLAALYEKNPGDYWLCNMLSQAFQQKKEYDRALEMGWRAVVLSGGASDQQINFGYLLYEIAVESPSADVREYARRWQREYPDDPIARHVTAAMLNAGHVSQIGSAYVRDIFDAFADDFEEVLSDLDYAVPSRMEEALEALAKNVKLKKMKILDAGCGTGLCGAYLKKYARFRGLDGVDISEQMLAVARGKKIYTHLYNQDLCKFLADRKNAYDLINAADVFTYFGELGGLFVQLYEALKPGGRVLFSISENTLSADNYLLHLSGRFLHRKNYVEENLQKRGFIIEKLNRVKLRNEGEKEVWGWIVMARKP